jgi:FMN phosphatase YigB (HAD superfamily)
MSIVLFDVDGVLITNKAISDYVTDKSIRYLQKYAKVPVQYKTYKNMKALNRMAYKELGHTSLIVDDTRVGVWNYNDYVFDEETIEFVKHALNDTDRRRMREIASWLENTTIRVGLCTNTPKVYVDALFEDTVRDYHRLFSLAFTSDTGLLKPCNNFYEHVENELCHDVHTIYFVDDSETNIQAVQDRPMWKGKHVPDRKTLLSTLRQFCE